MPFEHHLEKTYPKDAQSVYQATLKVTDKLAGKDISAADDNLRVEAHYPKVILGQTLGERTCLTCEVSQQGDESLVVLDAYPLDAVNRKLLFGARKGVTQTVVTWFIAHLENNLSLLVK